jgi:hypothetical protein
VKLDRNLGGNQGQGKYALLNIRKIDSFPKNSISTKEVHQALMLLAEHGVLDWGEVGSDSEFFLIKLKDEYALPALKAYANAAEDDDFEYATEVRDLAHRSGRYSKFCKKPD